MPCNVPLNPCHVLDLAVTDTTVFAGVSGPGGRVSTYDATTARQLWQTTADGDVQAVLLADGKLVVGGHFDIGFTEKPRAGLAALDPATGAVLDDWAPSVLFGLGVWDLWAEQGTLYAGGGFTRVGTDSTRQRFTAFALTPEPADTVAPSAPAGLVAAPVRDTRVTLTWSPATDDRGADGYRVSRDGTVIAVLGATTWVDRDVVPDTDYTYTVEARDAAGNWSAPSTPLAVRTRPLSASLVSPQTPWKYLSDGSDQGTAWTAPGFDDSTWSTGDAELGYGDGDEGTSISPLGVTSYFRRSFTVTDLSPIAELTLLLRRDDGAVAYLNGVEIGRSNLPAGPLTATTPALSEVTGADEISFTSLQAPASALVVGTNVLAVEVHGATDSTDLSFDAELVPVAPGAGPLVSSGDAWAWTDSRTPPAAGWTAVTADDSTWPAVSPSSASATAASAA